MPATPSTSHPLLASFFNEPLGLFRRALGAWYRRNARPLPWRSTADPYRIWISEIMLQQTTVTAVIPYYERFLAQFPTIRHLADAPEHDVLRFWEGLGYYSRARNIHRAARLIAHERAGAFPDSVEGWRELPGIGRYTAGAIVSFAFDRPAPIVEANTLRLYCRLLGFRGDPRTAIGQRLLWEFADSIVPRRSPGRFNQALMELGATVCTPERPACDCCPVRRWCAAFAQGAQGEIPPAAQRPTLTDVTEAAIAIHRNGRFLLQKRAAGERWAGLWDFVRSGVESGKRKAESRTKRAPNEKRKRSARRNGEINAAPSFVDLARHVSSEAGVNVEIGELLAELRHSVTRYRITLRCHVAEWLSGEPDSAKRKFE